MKLDLRNRFLLPTVAALLVAFAVYLGVSTHKIGKALEHAVHEEMTTVTDLVKVQLSSWMRHRKLDVARRRAFQDTADNASQVAVQVDSIAQAAREQALGIDQINKAVSQLDRTTQGAAANAEETASAAEELNAQASQLRSVVSKLHALVSGYKGGTVSSLDLHDQRLHALADAGAASHDRVSV